MSLDSSHRAESNDVIILYSFKEIRITDDLSIMIRDSINVIAVAEWSESLAMPGFDTRRRKIF